MSRRNALGFLSLCALAALLLAGPVAAQQPDGNGKSTVERARRLRSVLNESIETRDFQAPMTLKDALALLQDKVNARHKADEALPIFVHAEAFRLEGSKGPDVYETPVKFPPFPRRLSVAAALRIVLSQIPSKDATFLLRGGVVEITTLKEAALKALLQQKVLATFDKRPLSEALEELSALTGVSVVVDARAGDKLKAPVSATLNNDLTLEAALRLLADMADLKLFVSEESAYVTSAANALVLQKELRARQEEEWRRMWRELMPPPLEDRPPAPPEGEKKGKTALPLPGLSTGIELIEPPALREKINTNPLQAGMSLKEALDLFRRILKEKGKEVPVVVDEGAFKEATPDAPDLYDTVVKFPAHLKQMPLADALRLALSKVPTNNATFLWRQGVLEITTVEQASVPALMRRTVRAKIEHRPLRDALKELGKLGGITLLLDPRFARRTEFAVSADLSHGATLNAALFLLTNMAALESVTFENVVYVTSPANARWIRQEIEQGRAGALFSVPAQPGDDYRPQGKDAAMEVRSPAPRTVAPKFTFIRSR